MLVFNFAACVPVWIAVGGFGLYHLWLASGNTTTIEKWEKEKVSTMVRRGKIKEIKYPYVSAAVGKTVFAMELSVITVC
jgi:palmitoyltransferase